VKLRSGFECGASVSNFNDIKVGDVLESFHMQRLVLAEASPDLSLAPLGRSQPICRTTNANRLLTLEI